jgi:hypothetical protein
MVAAPFAGAGLCRSKPFRAEKTLSTAGILFAEASKISLNNLKIIDII